ncbi:MAG: GumC family protein, partial [Bosea sp. (in: a-proteobacteria)]
MYAIDTEGSAARGQAQQLRGTAGGLSLFQLIGAIFRCKLLIVLGALIGAALAVVIALTIPQRFISTAQILIDPRDLRVLQNEVTPGGILNDSTTAYLESQARVIASDKIKIRVIEQEKLTEDPEFGADSETENPITQALRNLVGAQKPQRTGDAVVMALEAMDKRIWVKRNERTFVIDIGVATRDAKKSARIANALAAIYFKDQLEVRSSATQRASTTLTSRLAELRDRVRDAEEKVQQFKTANDIASVGNRSVNEEQMTQASALLAGTRNRVADSKARFDQLAQLSPARLETGSLPEAVASNTITALRAQLGAAQAREAELVTLLGPSHPQMISARSQVRDSRRQIAEELARIVQAAKLDYERAIAAERSLVQRFGDLKRDSFATNQASVQLRELEREADANRSVYQAFLQRAREASELVGIDASNARVISDAMPATRPTGISRRLIVLGGALAGGALGLLVGLALLWGRNGARMNAAAMPVAPATPLDPPPANPPSNTIAERPAPSSRRFRRVVEPAEQADDTNKAVSEPVTPPKMSPPTKPAAAPGWSRSLATGPVWKRAAESSATNLSPMAQAEANVLAAGWKILARTPKAGPGQDANNGHEITPESMPEITSVFQDRGFPVDSFETPSSPFARSI